MTREAMTTWPGRAGRRLLARPRTVLAAWVALAALAAPGVLRLGHDNSPEVFFVSDHEAVQDFERFTRNFGGLGALHLWARGEGLWTPEGLAWLAALEAAAPKIDGIVAALGPWSYGRARRPDARWPPADIAAYRRELAADPLARNADLISSAADAVGVLMALGPLDAGRREALLSTLESRLERRPPGIEAGVAGLATLNRGLDRALARVLLVQFPIAILLAVMLVGASLRSARDTIIAMLFSAVCETVLLGLMGYSGVSFNVVTSVLPLLIFVLSLATGVHLLCDARESAREGAGAREAALTTYRRKAWPVVWTSVTTGAAFGSLVWSDSPPVRALGAWSAAGIGLVLLAALTLYPVLLAEGRRPAATERRSDFESWARRLGGHATSLALERGRLVHLAFGALFLAALTGLPRLEVETSVLEYFGHDHPLRGSIEALEGLGVGPVSAELMLELGTGRFDEPERLERLEHLAERLRARAPAFGALSLADLPPSQALFFRRARPMLVTEDGAATRVSISVPVAGFTRLEPFLESALETAREAFPEARASITGSYPMVLAAQRSLLGTMVVSLGTTLVIVVAVLLLLVRGRRLELAAVLPNLWPVAAALGLMGWLGVAVDSGTMMIAAVVLGLAVDDTLHFLGGLRAATPATGPRSAIRAALIRLAPAHLLTSAVLIAGFLVLATSDFLPVARFGAIAAAAITAALAGDLVWVPALAARSKADRGGSTGIASRRTESAP